MKKALRSRWSLVLLALLVAACAASGATVRRAKAAEYDGREYATVYEACKATLLESGYELHIDDVEHGILVSTWRWYSPEGARKKKETPTVENGSAMFRIGVELGQGPNGGIVVRVDGGAQGYSAGSPVARAFKHGDPEEPAWVMGRIDNIAVGIFERLQKHQLPAKTAAAK